MGHKDTQKSEIFCMSKIPPLFFCFDAVRLYIDYDGEPPSRYVTQLDATIYWDEIMGFARARRALGVGWT
jgi:hypothetical protein